MIRRITLVLLLSIAAAACAARTTPLAEPTAVPEQATPDLAIPEGWTAFRDDAHSFALAYPPYGRPADDERRGRSLPHLPCRSVDECY